VISYISKEDFCFKKLQKGGLITNDDCVLEQLK